MDKEPLPKQPALLNEIVPILRCPVCHGALEGRAAGLICLQCSHLFPMLDGRVCFVDAEKYASSFGFQWHRYARTQLDGANGGESDVAFRRKTGFTPAELAGKLVLDVGCGMGRFAEVASRWGARVVGVDLSSAAAVAAQNLAGHESVAIFQADLFSLPFAPESFDYIYSIGVLHHTPNCEQAFKALPRFLKPGGTIAVWLYSGYNKWYRFSDLYRKLTCRLPPQWLLRLCQVAAPLYYLHRGLRALPLVGRPVSGLLHHVFPISLNPDREWRVLDSFDWYSPRYQSKHTYEEVFRWFESCDLESIRVVDVPVALRGCRPARTAEGRAEPSAVSR